MVTIKIILGSTRPNRFGIQPANYLLEMAKDYAGKATIELVDLQEINLPLSDYPTPPAMIEEPASAHGKAWAKIVGDADGFVFVTSEYNHSFPASLKNAIDYLAKQWSQKPAAFVSYGAAAGGARAVDQLRAVVGHLNMYDITEHMILPNYFANLDENGQFKFDDKHEAQAKDMLDKLIFWAEVMKEARTKLS